MTVIATNGKVMVADKQTTSAGELKYSCCKLHEVGDWVLGTAGRAVDAYVFIDWFKQKHGKNIEDYPFDEEDGSDFCVLMVNKHSGEMRMYDETHSHFLPVTHPFFAIGSGRIHAMTAMHLGFDPVAAVQAACDLCPECGMGIDILKIKD